MTEIIGIEPVDHSQAVIDRVSSLLANKGVSSLAPVDYDDGKMLRFMGMANKRLVQYDLSPQHIPEDEIKPRSISIANEVEAAIRQARDPEAEE